MSKREQLSDHFYRDEFACKCGCGFDTVDSKLLKMLELVRVYFKTPVTISSGCRCEDYNNKIGGARKSATSRGSQHMYGRAADIVVKGFSPTEVIAFLHRSYRGEGGLGGYNTFTHLDSRTGVARW